MKKCCKAICLSFLTTHYTNNVQLSVGTHMDSGNPIYHFTWKHLPMAKMVYFQLEWTPRVQVFNHFKADQKPKYNIKGIVQRLLKDWQAWGIKHPSRKPAPVLDLPSKEMFPNFKTKLPQAQFEPFQCVLWLDPRKQSSAPPSNTSFPQESGKESNKAVPLNSFSKNLTNPKFSAAPHRTCLPSLSLVLLDPFTVFASFGCIRAP